MSRVVIVLTLQTRKEEGHLAYRSQSDNPLQGTTLGGSTDDPGRQHTRTAAARHAAGARGGRERGLPRSGDLPHGVLRSEEHTSELQSLAYLVCRLLLEKKKNRTWPALARPGSTA